MSNSSKKTSLTMRIVLFALAALMVGSMAFYTILMIVDQVRSNKEDTEQTGGDTGNDYKEDEHDHQKDGENEKYY